MNTHKDQRFIIPLDIYNNLGAKSQMMFYPYPGLNEEYDTKQLYNQKEIERQKPINNLVPDKCFECVGDIKLISAQHPIFLTSYYNYNKSS